MQSSQSFLALGHLHLHPCGYLRSLTGAGNPLAQAYHRAPAPRRPGAPAHSSPTTGPSFKTLSEPRQIFLGGIGLHLVLDMLPLPVQLTPPNLPHQEPVAASLLRHCFSQTRDRQTPWTQSPHKRRGWLWLNHHPCFSTSKMPKKSTGIYFILFCPKFPQRYFAKISCKIFRQNLMNDTLPKYPERYFARISHQIFCQNIPPDMLPEYPTRYFARISRQIFCQNIPPNILAKICQHIPQDILPK